MCAAETKADSEASCWVQEVAALQVKVHEANSRASGAETSLADAQTRMQDLREHLSQKQAIEAGLLGEVHDLANQLAAAHAKEQGLVEKLACKHANQQKLQAQVCSLASQLNGALASPHQVGVCCTTLHFAWRFVFLYMSFSASTHLKTQLVQAAVKPCACNVAGTEWVLPNKFTGDCLVCICSYPACCSWSSYRMFASLVHMAVASHCP